MTMHSIFEAPSHGHTNRLFLTAANCKTARMKRILFWLALPLLLVGCSHTVKYKLDESDRWTGPRINGVVYVKPFVDKAPLVTNKVDRVNKEVWRNNYRQGYENTNLSAQVSAMISQHLAYSGLFKGVSSNEVNANYILTGTLSDFRTHALANKTAEGIQAGTAGFGLIGALVGTASTSEMKSEIKTSVALSDVQLADKSGASLWSGSVGFTNDVHVAFQEADAQVLFVHPDQGLRQAVKELIQRMGNSSLTNQATLK